MFNWKTAMIFLSFNGNFSIEKIIKICSDNDFERIFQIGKTNCLELGNKESMQTRSEKQTLNCVTLLIIETVSYFPL